MKNKIWIVAQREYATRVKKRSFIILTILMPFLMAAIIFVPLLLSVIGDSGRKTVAVIDNTGLYADALQSNDDYLFVPTDKMTPALRSDSTDVAAVLMITDNLVDNPTAAAIYSRDEVKRDMSDYVNNALTKAVQKQKFERYNIPALNEIVEDVQTPVEVATVRWTDEGERESMTEIFSAVGMVLTTLIYFFVMSYGAMVMQSVTEEKTNRIVELMVSSVKPFQLMAGKIIGIGLVGITQMLIWGILLVAIISIAGVVSGVAMFDPSQAAAISAASQMPDADLSMQILSVVSSLPLAEIAVLFVLYFIGGYLLYASVLAGFGAAVNDPQDTQQFMMPIAVIMLFAFYAGFYSAMNPDGPLGRVAMGIYPATSGKLYYAGEELNLKNAATRFKYAKKAQIIFQDPYASLDPRMTVSSIIEEGMVIHGMYDAKRRQERVYELLELVGLNKEHANRFPHEFSGGQRQRIGIARALAIEPEFIVCDEPISALDVSIQSQIINLLHDLQQQLGLTFLFIAHDLNIVKYISDRIAVMYLGNVVELASSDDLYAHTLHPYSKALLSAVPIPDPSAEAQKHRQILSGDVPSPINTPKGCNFAGRCPVACDKCRESKPQLREIRPGHFCACHLVEPEI